MPERGLLFRRENGIVPVAAFSVLWSGRPNFFDAVSGNGVRKRRRRSDWPVPVLRRKADRSERVGCGRFPGLKSCFPECPPADDFSADGQLVGLFGVDVFGFVIGFVVALDGEPAVEEGVQPLQQELVLPGKDVDAFGLEVPHGDVHEDDVAGADGRGHGIALAGDDFDPVGIDDAQCLACPGFEDADFLKDVGIFDQFAARPGAGLHVQSLEGDVVCLVVRFVLVGKEGGDGNAQRVGNGVQGFFRYPLRSFFDAADVAHFQSRTYFNVSHGQVF